MSHGKIVRKHSQTFYRIIYRVYNTSVRNIILMPHFGSKGTTNVPERLCKTPTVRPYPARASVRIDHGEVENFGSQRNARVIFRAGNQLVNNREKTGCNRSNGKQKTEPMGSVFGYFSFFQLFVTDYTWK